MKDPMLPVLAKRLLAFLPNDFQASVRLLIESLSEFDRHHQKRFEQAFSEIEGDIKIGSEEIAKFLEIAQTEKTTGNALAKSVLIVTSSYVRSAARISKLLDAELFSVGPWINDCNWAQAIEVGANYIRHLDEWDIPSRAMVLRGEQYVMKNVKNVIGRLKTPKARRNANFLKSLGLRPEEIIGVRNDATFRLSKLLELEKFDLTVQRYRDWIAEVNKNI